MALAILSISLEGSRHKQDQSGEGPSTGPMSITVGGSGPEPAWPLPFSVPARRAQYVHRFNWGRPLHSTHKQRSQRIQSQTGMALAISNTSLEGSPGKRDQSGEAPSGVSTNIAVRGILEHTGQRPRETRGRDQGTGSQSTTLEPLTRGRGYLDSAQAHPWRVCTVTHGTPPPFVSLAALSGTLSGQPQLLPS